eukprot:COSAG04_NODE_1564_length_6324_cov_18.572369_7_plen_97_part_00
MLAQLITRFEANLTAAVKDRDRQAADTAAATLMEAYKDLDDLLECKQASSCDLGPVAPIVYQATIVANRRLRLPSRALDSRRDEVGERVGRTGVVL